MKALVYTGKKNLEFKNYNDPVQKDGEEIIEIKSVGICGSDMHAFLGHDERRPSPLILGHEPAGIIASGSNNGKKSNYKSFSYMR
jgi:L-iditol 2-dehydrogenase